MRFEWKTLEGKNVRVLSVIFKKDPIEIGAIRYHQDDRRWHLVLKDCRGTGVPLKASYTDPEEAQHVLARIWLWEKQLKDVSTEKWQQK